MTMTEREQSLLHHLVVWLALMVLFLQLVEVMTWMVVRCIEQKTGNKVYRWLSMCLVTASST
jgi:hypothetical protein